MTEKRVLIAALLSALFLAGYSQLMAKWYGPAARAARPSQTVTHNEAVPIQEHANYILQPLAKEDVTLLESDELRLEIGTSTGAIHRATLKQFRSSIGDTPLRFGGGLPLFRVRIGGQDLSWRLSSASYSSAAFNGVDVFNKHYHLSYMIEADKPVLQVEVVPDDETSASAEVQFIVSWERGDQLGARNNALEAVLLTDRGQGKLKHERHLATFRKERIVPRGTFLATLSERYFCLALKPASEAMAVSLIPSPSGTVALTAKANLNSAAVERHTGYRASLYIGPRDFFYLRRSGFDQAIAVGALGQIGLIFLMFLSWIGKLTGNYGIAIILFSCLVSCLTAPFTLMSLKSMKKMQELKPQIDRIMAAHKDNPTKANQQVMAIYKEHRVNPLSGCLPMFLQMPIFIALFQAISHFIELRGKRFLWIHDLSLPDRLARLPVSLPLIGNDLNLLPVIMAVAMYIQTKTSQARMGPAQNNPSAKMMSGPTMSVVFGIMFYQFPSGLVLYWLTNSLLSLFWYQVVK